MVCFSFNAYNYVTLLIIYFLLVLVFKNYEKKQILASNILAALNLYAYLWTENFELIINYYIYDTTITILHKDYLMLIHHMVTLYGITHCSDHADYYTMQKLVYIIKSSDLLFHHYQITKSLHLTQYKAVKIYQLFTIVFTMLAWTVLRFGVVISMMPFNTYKTHALVLFIHFANLWWLTKLFALSCKIYNSL